MTLNCNYTVSCSALGKKCTIVAKLTSSDAIQDYKFIIIGSLWGLFFKHSSDNTTSESYILFKIIYIQEDMSLKKNSKFSIKAKLLSAIIPITSAMIIVLVVIAYNVSASMIKRNAEELLETSVDKQSSNIESWMTENLNSFNSAKKAIEADRQNEKSLQKTVDSYYDFNANSKNGIYIADQNGKVIKAKKSDKTISNPLNSTWFKEGLTRVNMAFGDPYTSEDGSKVISATGMLDDNSKNIRVIAADFSLDRISNIVNSSISMEGAKAFLVNKNTMQIMADRNSSYVSEKIGSSDQPEIYAQAKKEIKKRVKS